MSRLCLLPVVLLLAGCDASPAPEFIGARRVDVTRDGRSYTVWHKDDRVEVVRLGYTRRSDRTALRQTMEALIPEVTGCRVKPASLRGDSGEIRANVTCK